MYDKVKFLIASEKAICVEFGNEISEAINAKIRTFEKLLWEHNIHGITETVPTYRSIMVHYSPDIILYSELKERLQALINEMSDMPMPDGKLVRVPVVYGGEYGPDLEHVARHNGLTTKEVIHIHTKNTYLIYMLGFTPGFAYMGGMDERIATPRLETPRVNIPGGSVGIAGSQTGIYPLDSPAGWQIIGRTPLTLFDHARPEPCLFEAGQRVQFYQITEKEFKEFRNAVDK